VEARLTRLVKSEGETALLVCAKCSKRLDGGFGKKGKQRLAKALKAYLGVKRFRKARIGVVEVKCLGVCPRGAVTVVNAADPTRWRLVARGADLRDVAAELGVGPQPTA
jgi:predicted metal-binding protein